MGEMNTKNKKENDLHEQLNELQSQFEQEGITIDEFSHELLYY